jgi:hypothetical protein
MFVIPRAWLSDMRTFLAVNTPRLNAISKLVFDGPWKRTVGFEPDDDAPRFDEHDDEDANWIDEHDDDDAMTMCGLIIEVEVNAYCMENDQTLPICREP